MAESAVRTVMVINTDPMYIISNDMSREEIREMGKDAIERAMRATDYARLIQDTINFNPQAYNFD